MKTYLRINSTKQFREFMAGRLYTETQIETLISFVRKQALRAVKENGVSYPASFLFWLRSIATSEYAEHDVQGILHIFNTHVGEKRSVDIEGYQRWLAQLHEPPCSLIDSDYGVITSSFVSQGQRFVALLMHASDDSLIGRFEFPLEFVLPYRGAIE